MQRAVGLHHGHIPTGNQFAIAGLRLGNRVGVFVATTVNALLGRSASGNQRSREGN